LLDDFYGLRAELFRFYAGSNVIELISNLTVAGDQHLELFDLTLKGLSALSLGSRPAASLVIYHTDLLRVLGYLPVFFECVSCGKSVLSDKKVFFSPVKGGALCISCGGQTTSKFAVGGGLLGKLHDLAELSPDQAEDADMSDEECGRLTVILLKYFAFILDREPRTTRYLLDRNSSRTLSKKAP
jgi:DNA repair protein RecO